MMKLANKPTKAEIKEKQEIAKGNKLVYKNDSNKRLSK